MIVLDCNAAVEIARGTKDGAALMTFMGDGEQVMAPKLFTYELANVVSKYARGGYISSDAALTLGEQASELVDEFNDDEDLWAEVVSESIRLQHSAYDLYYMLLTRRKAATLFTLDRKLQNLCLDNGVNCVYLDDEF
ncbi:MULTISPECIES: type II toxin-antitoxin system VapC family toxin [Gordonibacter]|uniref:Type II toxin-antitoxin system VapC family toxin n=1 Tax=Gordonibacter faecis TaxID=3047475 RepID=A0ABT7DMG3_9ACTN|nr:MULTISPECIES: type II toxin-antitoxin system VapC family toxin [unclassified Gordonibacter]MDJ1649758.1 type II toxin-antitoxin system VapC family toxin [Gordonibacter sp. KGMB12511]HIW76561.1 type II toxin-antitoxin system VapC family toxin [Candidatus Gordonibacter avicola]